MAWFWNGEFGSGVGEWGSYISAHTLDHEIIVTEGNSYIFEEFEDGNFEFAEM